MGFICVRRQPSASLILVSVRLFVAYLPLAASQGNVDETAGVLEALESTALGDLGLLLGLNLWDVMRQSSGASVRVCDSRFRRRCRTLGV